MLHEIFGLNDDIRRIARRFAENGYVALAPDLFDGPGPRVLCVARAVHAMKTGDGAALRDLDRARRHLAALPEVDAERLAVAGFCMGGGFALLLALRAPFRAAAPHYGEVPRHEADLHGICPVVAGFGGRDAMFRPHGERLERHLTALGVDHDVKIYPDAGHSYMNQHAPGLIGRLGALGPMRVGYDHDAAEDSWARILSFFALHVRGDD